jgi:hypothetical protein
MRRSRRLRVDAFGAECAASDVVMRERDTLHTNAQATIECDHLAVRWERSGVAAHDVIEPNGECALVFRAEREPVLFDGCGYPLATLERKGAGKLHLDVMTALICRFGP